MLFETITYYEFKVPTVGGGTASYETADPQEIHAYLEEGLEYEIQSTTMLAPWFHAWLFFAIMACLLYGVFAFWVLTWE